MIKTLDDLIALWPAPRIANFARDIGVTIEHGSAMKRRGSIPPARWNDVVEAAAKRNIQNITLQTLADLAATDWNKSKQPEQAA